MAGRQGRMHGSPFHVESEFYKYAVEHENEGLPIQHESVKCGYRNKFLCELWNSSFGSCQSHRCLYIKRKSLPPKNCVECAFYNNGCCHGKAPAKKEKTRVATYCCFYVSEADNPEKYARIRAIIRRIKLSNAIEEAKTQLIRKNKVKRQFEKQLSSVEYVEYKVFLKSKIASCERQIEKLKQFIAVNEPVLQSIGGKYKYEPTQKGRGKKKSPYRKRHHHK